MGFTTAVRTCLRKYVDFSGRARRSEFWWFYLFAALAQAVFTVPGAILIGVGSAGASDTSGVSAGGGVAVVLGFVLYGIGGLVALALLLPTIAAGVRRLHDTDRPGWWYLLTLVPVANLVVVVFWILDGTAGPNRFGPSPKDLGAAGSAGFHGQQDAYGQSGQGYGYPTQT